MDFVFCILDKLANSITIDGITKTIELGLAFWGCFIAAKGLKTWREQIIEQPKIELAREIVEQFYNIKDLIARARSPLISFSPDEVRKFYEMDNLTEYQTELAYRLMTLDKSIDQIQSFQQLRNKSKVFYSKEIENCFFEVNKILNLFKYACKSMMKATPTKSLIEIYGEKLQKEFFERVYEQVDNDATNLKLQNVIEEIEYNLKPIYEARTVKWKKITPKTKEQTNDQ
jgi:hypothetical protein